MHNPLHFSSEYAQACRKRALEAYNAPYADMLNKENITGVQDFWKNLQSYPQDIQKYVYDQMGQIEVPGNSYGGFGNMLSHGASQAYNRLVDPLKNIGNNVSRLWGGGRTDLAPNEAGSATDVIGTQRDQAKRVYDLAMQNPQYMARLQSALPGYEAAVGAGASKLRENQAMPAAPAAPTPATPAPAAPAAPTPATPAPAAPAAPTPATPAPAAPAAPTPATPAPVAPAAPTPATPAPAAPATPTLISAPPANPQPWTDAKSRFDPNWTKEQKGQYMKSKYGETTDAEKSRSQQVSNYYNPKPVAPTTNRWGGALQPAPLNAGQQYQKDWVNGTFDKNREAKKIETRNNEAMDRGQARIAELTAQHGPSYWDGEEGKKDLARYQKGIY
jgi:hypothetical protein